MKKSEIAGRLARRAGLSKAEAADQLDRLVHEIVANLRRGQAAPLPGLGKFLPGSKWQFQFEKGSKRRK